MVSGYPYGAVTESSIKPTKKCLMDRISAIWSVATLVLPIGRPDGLHRINSHCAKEEPDALSGRPYDTVRVPTTFHHLERPLPTMEQFS